MKWLYIIGAIVLVIVGFLFFRLPQPIIELKPESLFSIGAFEVTNTILTAWIMIILIALITKLGTRKLTLVPSGFQNLFEALIEGFGTIVNNAAGERNGRRFFPVVFALFFYIVFCNWMALLPVFNVIGLSDNVSEELRHEAQTAPDETFHESEVKGWVMTESGSFGLVPLFTEVKFVSAKVPDGTSNAQAYKLLDDATVAETGHTLEQLEEDGKFVGTVAPFLRGVNTDLNAPLGYALWSAIFVEMWGITALGIVAYGGKFFNFGRLLKGDIMNGLIDVFVGILELISEFARLISFTFRLFGNIFAGEVLLFMMSFLVPFLLIEPFYGLELFVGLIQGFVFAMLTLVFGVMAVSVHAEHAEDHGPHTTAEQH
jgi:F-type H+-transporting ATPase subunit a